MSVIDELLESGVSEIRVFDPVAMESMKFFGNRSDKIIYCHSSYETLQDSDALILLTEWDEFLAPDWKYMKKLMK
jgi:UDPglucose 6-dehydrogenase